MHIREAIIAVADGHDLEQEAAAAVMEQMMNGEAAPAQIAALLTALHIKGETAAEIAGMAAIMRAHAVAVPHEGAVVDTCGTGGDRSNTFNISTAAAFVAAGAGVTVAKHGNRAMSSKCGSADVLEGLGVNIELDADGVAACLAQAGIGFMFAPLFHPSMRYAGPVRREIGIRTIFNVLGPLTNPARAEYQVLGVASAPLAHTLAHALSRMSIRRALVVHGTDGLDELSLSAPTLVYDVRQGQEPQQSTLHPAELGLSLTERHALQGGDVATNVQIIRAILDGSDQGPRRDIVALNAAAALVACEQADSLADGLHQAQTAITSGAAAARLSEFIAVSQAVKG